jgi:hypothetical protein
MPQCTFVINDRVKTEDSALGKITNITKNGWYTIELETGGEAKVRGVQRLRRVPPECTTPPHTNSTQSARTISCTTTRVITVDLDKKKNTRSQLAGLRRDEVVDFIRSAPHLPPPVKPIDIRLVLADGDNGNLRYQTMDSTDPTVFTSPDKELKALKDASPHFEKAWAYVNHKDSAQVRWLDRNTPYIIYLAVMSDQAYVGLAKHGVMHRWAGYRYNHMQAANNIVHNTKSDNLKLQSQTPMLVDASMRVHCSTGGKVWIFTIQNNPYLPLRAEEKRLIHYFETFGVHGMNATT